MKFWRNWQRRRQQQSILAEELQSHLDELAEELIATGYTPDNARLEARRQFGNGTTLLEESRAVWRIQWLDALLRDLRFSWRLARRQPWTTAAAIASIAIGVGANTAVTSVVDTVLLNPLGIRHSEQIIAATVHLTHLQMTDAETSGAEFRDLQSLKGVFSSVTATEPRAWTIGGDEPSRLIGLAVTPDFLKVFDQPLAIGHFFDGSNPNEVLLSDGLWTSRFARDPGVIGHKLELDGRPYRIAGVASPAFHFPAKVQAWIPLLLTPDRMQRGNNMSLSLYARLNSGVTAQQAQVQIDHKIADLSSSAEGLDIKKFGYGIDFQPISRHVAGDLRLPLLLLWSAAFVLLLTACANIAGLLLARAGGRRKEIAIRISIGASRLQILRQLFTESVILALLGGVAGIALAAAGVEFIKHQPLPYQHLFVLVTLNRRMLFYGMALALASSVIFGLIPALELVRDQHVSALARARRKWFQNVYIVAQVSAAMLLMVVTGLLLKSLRAVESLRPGFDAENLTTAFLIKPTANQNTFYDQLLSKLKASPGIQSAALTYSIPFGDNGDAPTSLFQIKGRLHPPGMPEWHAEAFQISPGYFETMRISLLRGRSIAAADAAGTPLVCVIDSTMAKRFFPNEDPIGQEIAMYSGYARIVGIVSAIRDQTLESMSRPAVYYSLAQIPYFPEIDVVVRSVIPAASLIRNAVAQANPAVPVFDVKTMDERIDASVSTRSVMAIMVTAFAGISILLAAIGIHGVVAQIVTERTSEIGIRMALGAKTGDIFRRYAMQGFELSIAGIAFGVIAAAACRGWLRSFVYQVQPIDPQTMVVGMICILLISGLAVLAPAWRASHLDPQMALRTE